MNQRTNLILPMVSSVTTIYTFTFCCIYLFICVSTCVFVCGGVMVHACHSIHVEARGFCDLLQPCGSQGSNSDHQAWQHVSSLPGPSCRPDDFTLCIFYWETFNFLSVTARLPFMVQDCHGSISFYSHHVMSFPSAACAPKGDPFLALPPLPSPPRPCLRLPSLLSFLVSVFLMRNELL